tara:strand:+ start:49 stop:678 length:630 start_codon:yes stop_codon:yes gene_type:complete
MAMVVLTWMQTFTTIHRGTYLVYGCGWWSIPVLMLTIPLGSALDASRSLDDGTPLGTAFNTLGVLQLATLATHSNPYYGGEMSGTMHYFAMACIFLVSVIISYNMLSAAGRRMQNASFYTVQCILDLGIVAWEIKVLGSTTPTFVSLVGFAVCEGIARMFGFYDRQRPGRQTGGGYNTGYVRPGDNECTEVDKTLDRAIHGAMGMQPGQ